MKVNEGLEGLVPLASDVVAERKLAKADDYRRIVGEIVEGWNRHKAALSRGGEVVYAIKGDDEATILLFKKELFSLFGSRGYRVVLRGLMWRYEKLVISINEDGAVDEGDGRIILDVAHKVIEESLMTTEGLARDMEILGELSLHGVDLDRLISTSAQAPICLRDDLRERLERLGVPLPDKYEGVDKALSYDKDLSTKDES